MTQDGHHFYNCIHWRGGHALTYLAHWSHEEQRWMSISVRIDGEPKAVIPDIREAILADIRDCHPEINACAQVADGTRSGPDVTCTALLEGDCE